MTARATATAVYLLASIGLVVVTASWLTAVTIACWGVTLRAAAWPPSTTHDLPRE